MNDTSDDHLIPVSTEATDLTDKWVREMGEIFDAAGIPNNDFGLIVYALHSIAHAYGGIVGPGILAGAAVQASDWFDACEDDWVSNEFAEIVKRFGTH